MKDYFTKYNTFLIGYFDFGWYVIWLKLSVAFKNEKEIVFLTFRLDSFLK